MGNNNFDYFYDINFRSNNLLYKSKFAKKERKKDAWKFISNTIFW